MCNKATKSFHLEVTNDTWEEMIFAKKLVKIKSMSEFVRRAIQLYIYIIQERRNGGRFVLQKPTDGEGYENYLLDGF